MGFRGRFVAVVAVSALSLWGLVGGAGPATATTCSGISGPAFFTAPASVTGPSGTVLSCRSTTWKGVPGVPAHVAWDVVYSSTDQDGARIAVSGGVAVPAKPWTGPGARPVVVVAPGSQGLGSRCGFARQLSGGVPPLEAPQIAGLLRAGYAVATTDYQGYLAGEVPTYLIGRAEAHAVLDAVRAGQRLAGLSRTGPVAIVGYSQGGHASLWAAQEAKAYAPELHVVADASGSIPADLAETAKVLDGGLAAGFMGNAAVGTHEAYPALPFDELLNDRGRTTVAKLKTQCFAETVLTHVGEKLSQYTEDQLTLDQLLALKGTDGVSWRQRLDEQTLVRDDVELGFPVYMYRPALDEIVPTSTEDRLHAAYCAAGADVTWKVYPADHLLTVFASVDDVLKWLDARFHGRPTAPNC